MKAISTLTGLFLLLAAPSVIRAQQGPLACPAATAVRSDTTARQPDVVISATTQIRELRFETRPQASIELRGCPALDSVRVERVSLPRRIQTGVTYRDVTVGLEATSYLNVECLLAPAGGAPVAGDSLRAGLARALPGLCSTGAADTTMPARRPRR